MAHVDPPFHRVSQTARKVLPGPGVSGEVSTGEEATSHFTYVVTGGIQFLEGHWSDDLASLLVGEWRLC